MGERAQRIGRNEAVFRIVNERLEDLSETFGPAAGPMQLVCECGSAACTESISVSASEYEAVRADAELFVVAHGHVADDVERVVEERPAYDVVRKAPGAPAMIARATDPRDAA